MRTAFISQLTLRARLSPDIFLIVGDLGFSVVEPFASEFPDRFLNSGVAEQNMTGVAAGLASEGFHVFTYSIANFSTLRCLEQIRNDICGHRLPVTVVAVGGGLAYGNLGYSHHAVQDLAVMRTLPNICVMAPGDPGETIECVNWLVDNPGPSYLRIGKAGERKLHSVSGVQHGPLLIRNSPSFQMALVSTGGILDETLAASDILLTKGKSVAVFSLPWIKPIDGAQLKVFQLYNCVVAVDEHVPEGGLASVLRENLPQSLPVYSVALNESSAALVGSQSFLRDAGGVSCHHIAACCLGLLT